MLNNEKEIKRFTNDIHEARMKFWDRFYELNDEVNKNAKEYYMNHPDEKEKYNWNPLIAESLT